MTKSEIEILHLLEKGQKILEKFKTELADPACHKRFHQNIHLLLGAHNMALTVLSKKVEWDISSMSKLISGKTKLERIPIELFEKIANALGVSVHSLLFIDLQKNFFDMIKRLENPSV
jgi:DNA-binding Xre family transcriptional regulator